MRPRRQLSSVVAMVVAAVSFGGGFVLSLWVPAQAQDGDALVALDEPIESEPWEEDDAAGLCEDDCLAYDGVCLCLQ